MIYKLDFQTVLPGLEKSKFRMKFQLDKEDRVYIKKIGSGKLREHAQDFVQTRLSPAEPLNDGKQTPFKGHPVFKAQHATATCCRGCLKKWYGISKGRALTREESRAVVSVLIAWIERQLQF